MTGKYDFPRVRPCGAGSISSTVARRKPTLQTRISPCSSRYTTMKLDP